MNNKILIVVFALLGFFIFGYFVMSVSYKGQEARLRNAVKAKQEDNKNEFDNVWKKISQVAQVTEEQREALKDIIVGYAQGRGTGGGSLAKSVTEAVPNLDTKVYQNLQNIITSARDGFTARQKELLDLKREHDNLIDSPISGFFLSGVQKIDVKLVTSTRTEKSFETGKDDDDSVFRKHKPTESR